MELISAYISNFKGTEDSYINLNSCYYSEFEDDFLKIYIVNSKKEYYNHIPSTILIGKNGSGKSTLLSFIENFHAENNASGFLVWRNDEQYEILLKNYPKFEVQAELNVAFHDNARSFYRNKKGFTIKINNGVDFYSHVFKSSTSKHPHLIDLSLASVENNTQARIGEVKKIVELLKSEQKTPDAIHKEAINFSVFSEFYDTKNLQAIVRKNAISAEKSSELAAYFWAHADRNHLKLTNKNSREERYPFISFRSFDGYLNNRERDSSLHFFSMMFDKNGFSNTTLPSEGIQTFNLLPALIAILVKKSGVKEQHSEKLFLFLLIDIYFSNHKKMHIDIKHTIARFYDHQNISQTVNEAIQQFNKNIRTIRSILTPLQRINKNVEFNGKRVKYLIDKPELISDTILKIRSLPPELENEISFAWDGLSSGQISILHFYARLHDVLNKFQSQNDVRSAIILIDEVDLYLHPDLQRTTFSDIIDFIHERRGKNNYQLILTSHSPLVASDFLPNDIIALSRESGNRIKAGKLKNIGFGSTISEFMTDGFFLDSTIGSRALQKVRFLIDHEGYKLSPEDSYIRDAINNTLLRKIVGLSDDQD